MLACVSFVKPVHKVRTNIEIDDSLMAATLQATGLRTKREAVELGLQTLLRLRQQSEIKSLRGKISWEGDLDAMRRDNFSGDVFATADKSRASGTADKSRASGTADKPRASGSENK